MINIPKMGSISSQVHYFLMVPNKKTISLIYHQQEYFQLVPWTISRVFSTCGQFVKDSGTRADYEKRREREPKYQTRKARRSH